MQREAKRAAAAAGDAGDKKRESRIRHLKMKYPKLDEAAIIQALSDARWNAEDADKILRQKTPEELEWATSKPSAPQKKRQDAPAAEGTSRSPARGDRSRAPHKDRPARDPDEIIMELDVPVDKYGTVVGRDGTTLHSINRTYSVRCNVPGRHEKAKVTLKGKREHCERAKARISELCSLPDLKSSIREQQQPPALHAAGEAALTAARARAGEGGGRVLHFKQPARPATSGQPAVTGMSWAAVSAKGVKQQPPNLTSEEFPAAVADEEHDPVHEVPSPPATAAKITMHHSPADKSRRKGRKAQDVPPSPPARPQYRNGMRVQVREKEGDAWTVGTVVVVGEEVRVRPDGWVAVLPFKFIEPIHEHDHPARQPSPPPPEPVREPEVEPTAAEKLSGAWSCIDLAGTDAVTVDQLGAGMCRARIDLPREFVQKLHSKMADGAPTLDYNGFRRNLHLFPLLLDALFWRPRDSQTDSRQREAMQIARAELDRLRDDEDGVRQEVERIVANVRGQEDKARAASVGIESARSREREVEANVQHAAADVQRAQDMAERKRAEQKQALSREQEARVNKENADKRERAADLHLRALEKETKKAEKKLEEVLALVQEAERELRRRQQLDDEALVVLKQERKKKEDASHDEESAMHAARAAMDVVRAAESQMQESQKRVHQLKLELTAAKEDTQRKVRAAADEQDQLHGLRSREAELRDRQAVAAGATNKQEDKLQNLEAEDKQREEQQREEEEAENDAVCRQIEIRFKRDELEQEEKEINALRPRRKRNAGSN
eukprot:TRINITY_DN1003_c2_g1_i1.p1 TRINITY_DN1003_c2_g1~~TRINITY_DN1003_c2_g1_i1.p1  ORF type:complete len:783 (+),score=313.90 TRINITY_DN1003_c2_g1_i1:88-2436(+)